MAAELKQFSGRLVIVRHAHRDMSDPHADNGLSEKGRSQVAELVKSLGPKLKKIQGGRGKDGVVILSSPKVRCQETIMPLADFLGLEVEIDSRLDTQGLSETSKDMSARIDAFAKWFSSEVEKTTRVYVVCSHGDWIPDFTREFCGEQVTVKKGNFVQF